MQSLASTHWTQYPAVDASPTVAMPVQWVRPAVLHCALLVHDATHVSVLGLHEGVATGHEFAVGVHWTHWFDVVLHAGVVPEQLEFWVHCTQVSFALHAGVRPLQFAFDRHRTHRFVVVLHSGVVPPQFPFARHCTQRFVVVSHSGVVPPQFVFDRHCTHAFVVRSQCVAVPAVHSVSPRHCTHVIFVVLQ